MISPLKHPLFRNGWFLAAIALFAVDRLLKYIAVHGTVIGDRALPVYFRLFYNYGIAFSLPLPQYLFWPAALFILAVLLRLLWLTSRSDPWRAGLYAMVIFGAVSNMWDRYTTSATIDYLIFFSRSAVNVADGMIILALGILCFAARPRHLDASAEKSAAAE